MIESIKMISIPIHQFNYLSEESLNKQVRDFVEKLYNGIQFKPGLNYIVGENGSGKSTLLNIIKSANRCEKSFVPKSDYLKITTIKEMNELFDAFEIKQGNVFIQPEVIHLEVNETTLFGYPIKEDFITFIE